MTDVFSIALKADSSDIKKAATDLDKLSGSANKAEKSASNYRKELNAAGKAVATFGAAAAAALGALTVSAANSSREIANLSRLTNQTVEDFQRTAFAAKAYGVEQDKLSDILKDTQDKVGDFLTTGAGGMVDFFEKVAPLVGVTAENFRELNGREALQLYVSSLEKANVSQSEMVFYLEAIASDATLLQPLLANNGAEMQRLADRAEELGLVLDGVDFENLSQMKTSLSELSAVSKATSDVIGATLAPYVTDLSRRLLEVAPSADQVRDAMIDVIHVGARVVGVFADAAHVGEIFGKALGALAFTAVEAFDKPEARLAQFGNVFALTFRELQLGLIEWVNEQDITLNKWASNMVNALDVFDLFDEVTFTPGRIDTSEIERAIMTLKNDAELLDEQLAESNKNIAAAWDDIHDALMRPLPSDGIMQWVGNVTRAVTAQRELQAANRDTADSFAPVERAALGVGKRFADNFAKGADSVADAVSEALISGDWSSIGVLIGDVLAASIGQAISATITESLAKKLTADSGLLAQVGAAFAGPLAGAAVGAAVSVMVREIEDYFRDDFDIAASRQASLGTGTVLGSINEKSASIAKAAEMSASATGELVGINRDMLRALEELNLGISKATARVALGVSQTVVGAPSVGSAGSQVSQFAPAVMPNAFGFFGEVQELFGKAADAYLDVLSAFTLNLVDFGSLLGGKVKEKDFGVQIVGGYITDLIDETVVNAFRTFRVKKNALDDYDTKEAATRIGGEVENQIALVFSSIFDSVSTASAALGLDVSAALEAFQIETTRISLKGLDAAGQQAALEAYFSSVFDELAAATVPFLEEFQRAGEGLGETLVRVATTVQTADEVLGALGIQFDALQADGFAPVLQMLPGMSQVFGEVAEQMALVANIQAKERLVELSGGIENFISSSSNFIRNFMSEAEQFELSTDALTRALGDLGLPETRQGFLELLQAQNAATESGAENIATILRLQGAADQYYDFLEKAEADRAAQAEAAADTARREAERQAQETARALEGAAGSALGRLRVAVQNEQAALRDQLEADLGEVQRIFAEHRAAVRAAADTRVAELQARLEGVTTRDEIAETAESAFDRLARSIGVQQDAIRARVAGQIDVMNRQLDAVSRQTAALSQLSDVLASSVTISRQQAKAAIQDAIDAARGGQSLAGVNLSREIGVATNVDENAFGSALALQQERARTADQLGQLKELADGQLTAAERNEQLLRSQISTIQAAGDRQVEALEDTLTAAREQLDALQGIDSRLLSISEAQALFDDATAQFDQLAANEALAEQLRAQILETEAAADRQIEALNAAEAEAEAAARARFDEAQATLEATLDTAQQQLDALLGVDSAVRTLAEAETQFAAAMFALAENQNAALAALQQQVANVVPRQEVLAPPVPITAQTTPVVNSSADFSVEDMLRSIALQSAKTAKILSRWDGDGQPEVRNVS